MTNRITKPLSVAKKDLVKDLVEVINASNLPMFLVEYVLRDVLNQVHAAVVQQEQEEERLYRHRLTETKTAPNTEADAEPKQD